MMGKFEGVHQFDEKGRPAGGCTCGLGFCISWQDGPLGRGEDRDLPNGAFVETVIAAVVDRLEHYQRTEFACEYRKLSCTWRLLWKSWRLAPRIGRSVGWKGRMRCRDDESKWSGVREEDLFRDEP